MGKTNIRFLDLAIPGISSDLSDDFKHLADACCADRVSFCFQAAAWIDRFGAFESGHAIRDSIPALPWGKEAQVFCIDNLGDGEAVMNFCKINISRFES